MRGLYRWLELAAGSEVWLARVDLSHGEWATLTQAKYESEGGTPTFGDLPLKDEHLREALNDGGTS